jgi:hypothetical protein
MTKTQMSKPKVDKPFLAARIPYGLEQALETHVKSTNESKTQTIIKALSAYLKWSDESSSPNASDRLSKLERKVAEIEKLLKAPQQTSFLDADAVITEDIKFDNKTITESELDKGNAARLMTHKEMSELTGKKYSTVKARARSANRIIKWEGRTFDLIQLEGQWRWKEIFDNKR